MQMTLCYIPTGNKETADQLSTLAIEAKLAACANIFPVTSFYPWEGAMQHDSEVVLLLKTIPSLKKQLQAFILDHHPYDVPCVMQWDVDVNDAYATWIIDCVRK